MVEEKIVKFIVQIVTPTNYAPVSEAREENKMIVPILPILFAAICVAFAVNDPTQWMLWPVAVWNFGAGILYAILMKK